MAELDLSVVVVNYRGRGRLGACLDGLAAQAGVRLEVVVVDNASPDGSWDEAENRPRVRLVRNARNVGFGAACNQGARVARGRNLAFLNFDSVPARDWAAQLVAVADGRPELGAAMGVVLLPDGQVNTAGNRLHYLGFSWSPVGGAPPGGPPYPVWGASGASLLVPARWFWAVGGFWEPLFLYFEDTDLSWRLHLLGLEVLAVPAATSVHDYEFGRNPQKLFLLERNRLLTLLANAEASTLRRIAPALLGAELALLAVAARDRWLGGKLRSWASLAAHAGELRRQRRRVQAGRHVPDLELARQWETRLGDEFGAGAARLSAVPLKLYARLVGIPAGRRRVPP